MSWRLLQLALLAIVLAVVVQLDDPAFTAVRVWAASGLIVLGLGLALLHIRARGWMCASFGVACLSACLSACWVVGWLMVAGLAGHVLYVPHAARNSILQAAEREPARMAALGEHLVIGYDDSAEVRELARRGLIGGVFATRRNIVGKTSTQTACGTGWIPGCASSCRSAAVADRHRSGGRPGFSTLAARAIPATAGQLG